MLMQHLGGQTKSIMVFSELAYSHLGATRLVGYLPSHIQRALME